ncbi:MAG: DNA polymerase III subunit delta' [Aquificae bacterium]|nr:DNA polymerase III subunit delta' [Aquificota bacterium]
MEKVFLEKLQKTRRVPSGLLFYGKEGSGKTKRAFEFAKGLLCKEGVPWGCGECVSCKHVSEMERKFFSGETQELKVYGEAEGKKTFLYLMGEHPDLILVVPSGNFIKIDQIRAIKDFVSLKPALSGRKVVIVDDAHTMTNQSANALLKTLEEPPPDTTFILTTSRRSAILPTILSRTFQVEFKGFTKEEIKKLAGVDEELASLSGGSLKKAKLLKENPEVVKLAEDFLSLSGEGILRAISEFEKWDTEKRKLFLDVLEELLSRRALEEKHRAEEYERALERLKLLKDGLSRGLSGSLGLTYISSLL